jgi:UDP-2,4-diacetamido-2,4,6-trideoxy-beta-L-altropyranose hydrolase
VSVFVLRPAAIDDCAFLYRLSMEPSVRVNSVRSDEFTFQEHEDWFAKKLADDDARIWIALEDDIRFGQVRYQRVVYGKQLWSGGPVATPAIGARLAEVSIALSDGWRGRGWGRTLLGATTDWARRELRVKTLVALVLANNAASVATFRSAGYRWTADEERLGKQLWRYEKEMT